MIKKMDRSQTLTDVEQSEQWDMIVVGGGVVGAGIFKFATQLGLKVLLLEQKDFAWGSSSRSSKMVHGGLRYVAQGEFRLTRESVEEREILIEKAAGLVHSNSYVMSHYRRRFPGKRLFKILMWIYGHFAGKNQHKQLSNHDYNFLMPGIKQHKLTGGTQYIDALTDDARLVFRLIQEAKLHGGVALNYTKVVELLRDGERVCGVTAQAEDMVAPINLNAKMVVNATGPWADKLDSKVILRPLRGSHVLVPNWRLPISSVMTLLHPKDRRAVMIYPWQNTTLIGTTDLDHRDSMDFEPKMTSAEMDYLLEAIHSHFPAANLQRADVISTYAGVRPIVLDKPVDANVAASNESREHAMFCQPGFISITGGKMTTFRVIANEVMAAAATTLGLNQPIADFTLFDNADSHECQIYGDYLSGRYGCFVKQFVDEFSQGSSLLSDKLMAPIRYSQILWAELIFAVKYEQVNHLDDLLLRRTRLGNVLPNGAKAQLTEIKQYCQAHMDWSEDKWQQEIERYLDIWQQYYSVPA